MNQAFREAANQIRQKPVNLTHNQEVKEQIIDITYSPDVCCSALSPPPMKSVPSFKNSIFSLLDISTTISLHIFRLSLSPIAYIMTLS
mmetsp:Transcript_19648/g.36782  ORF Transcript_19648/g.36782 Transcript_19648/m.36782 type:complete len:88 (-) Transcript_19648:298-561(-)